MTRATVLAENLIKAQHALRDVMWSIITPLAVAASIIAGLLISVPGGHGSSGSAVENSVRVHILRTEDCVDCDSAVLFLDRVAGLDAWLSIDVIDLESSEPARRAYQKILEIFSVDGLESPVAVVGTHVVAGYEGDESSGLEILAEAQRCRWFDCADLFGMLVRESKPLSVDVRYRNQPRLIEGLGIGATLRRSGLKMATP